MPPKRTSSRKRALDEANVIDKDSAIDKDNSVNRNKDTVDNGNSKKKRIDTKHEVKVLQEDFQSLKDTISSLQDTVASLSEKLGSNTNSPTEISAHSAIEDNPQTGFSSDKEVSGKPTRPSFGVSPNDICHYDIVSPGLRAEILSGKDVNLESLLIPDFHTEGAISRSSAEGSHL